MRYVFISLELLIIETGGILGEVIDLMDANDKWA